MDSRMRITQKQVINKGSSTVSYFVDIYNINDYSTIEIKELSGDNGFIEDPLELLNLIMKGYDKFILSENAREIIDDTILYSRNIYIDGELIKYDSIKHIIEKYE